VPNTIDSVTWERTAGPLPGGLLLVGDRITIYADVTFQTGGNSSNSILTSTEPTMNTSYFSVLFVVNPSATSLSIESTNPVTWYNQEIISQSYSSGTITARVKFNYPASTGSGLQSGTTDIRIVNRRFVSPPGVDVNYQFSVTAYTYSPPVITSSSVQRYDNITGLQDDFGSSLRTMATFTFSPADGTNAIIDSHFTWRAVGQAFSSNIPLASSVWSAPFGGNIKPHLAYEVVVYVQDSIGYSATKIISVPAVPPVIPPFAEYWGLLSQSLSQSNGEFTTPVQLDMAFWQPVNIRGIFFAFNVFDGSYCNDMSANFVYSDFTTSNYNLNPDSSSYYFDIEEDDVTEIHMLFNGMNKADRFLWLQKLVFGRIYNFTSEDIVSHNTLQTHDLTGSDLSIGSLDFSLLLPYSNSIPFNRRRNIRSYFKDILQGTFYADDVDRESLYKWKLRCVDIFDVLNSTPYAGDIYYGNAAKYIIADIADTCGATIDTDVTLGNRIVTGWLQISSCRRALVQVVFAIGGVITADETGVIHITERKDQVTSHFDGNRCMMGVPVKTDKLATREVRLFTYTYETQLHESSPVYLDNNILKVNTGWDVVGTLPGIQPQVVTKRIEHSSPYDTGISFKHGNLVVIGVDLFWVDFHTANPIYIRIYEFEMRIANANVIEFSYGGNFQDSLNIWYDASSLPTPTKDTIRDSIINRFPVYDLEICRVPMKSIERLHSRENPSLLPDEQSRIAEYRGYTLTWNAQSLLDHLYDIEVNRTETASATVILESEKVGDCISIDTDFGVRTGNIVSMNKDINNSVIAQIEVRV